MPNPNRPENVTSIVWPSRCSEIAVGATVAVLIVVLPYPHPVTAHSIRHVGVTTRYIDTNTCRRAADDSVAARRGQALRWRSMALHLHRAERTDLLADGLGALLAGPLPDPFAEELVIVPAKGVERWLSPR